MSALAPAAPSIKEVCEKLWRNVTFRHLLLCLSVLYLFGYGILQWLPTFFIRSYGFSTGEIGTWLAVTYGIGALIGTFLGGEWATRYAANNEPLQLKAMAIAIAAAGIAASFVYLLSNPYLGFFLIAVYVFGIYTINGSLSATIQALVPENMRGVSIALVYMVANLIGMGLGPLAAGVLSDALQPWAGKESLRYALLALGPGYFWGAWHAWQGSKSVARDLTAAERSSAPVAAEQSLPAHHGHHDLVPRRGPRALHSNNLRHKHRLGLAIRQIETTPENTGISP